MQPGKRTKWTTGTKGSPGPSSSLKPLRSFEGSPQASDAFIPPHGGYQTLLSYQMALIVFDATVYFCGRFLEKRDRTYDQMIQAARSGK